MEIDRESMLPLYYQIKEILKEEIDIGKYTTGDKVPSENELSSLLGISRNTSKQAISDLVSEGILYRIQGKGTYVAEKKIFRGLTEAFSFSKEFNHNGSKLITKVIFAEEIIESKETIKFLKLKKSSEIFRIQRLRLQNNTPVALQTSYIPKFFCPDLLSFDLSQHSLFDVLKEKYKVTFGYFTEHLSCIKSDQYEAELLKIKKDSPLFHLTRKTFNKNDEIVEVARSFMPGDRCEFHFGKDDEVKVHLKIND